MSLGIDCVLINRTQASKARTRCCMVPIGSGMLWLWLLCCGSSAAMPPDFDKQIAPILAARCLDCHSGPKPRGGLDLSRKAKVLAGENPTVIPGNPTESELWKRIAAREMPPKKSLPEAEARLIKEWIERGAPWGSDPIDPFRFTTSSRAGYDWWALQPVRRPVVPSITAGANAIQNDIDRFILQKQSEPLRSSPPAERRTLIRRVYFDLTGLPPRPEEVTAFEKDQSADAYEKIVDQLLASPHYGERWARHWLDIVRFGESDGFERNTPRPNAWHYRDWVIRAFNSDLPYDEFVRLQLAGDVLRPNDPEALRATGFLVAAVHNTVLGNEQMRLVARQDELEDLVGSVGQTFLGLTTNCARCHDHKFDPISQTDYYRLAATLSGVNHGERPLPDPQRVAESIKLTKRRDRLHKELALLEEPARRAVLAKKGLRKSPLAGTLTPIAAWDFRISGKDLVGTLHATPHGGVRVTPDGALFDGKTGFLRTSPLPFDLKAKTLEAWIRLDSLAQRGGGVISVQTPDGVEFDAVVFGEQEPARWMAGSNGFVRTKSFNGPEETEAVSGLIHFAITYSADGTITGYRNGKPYGRAYATTNPHHFASGKAVVIFGCRHEPAGGNKLLAGTVSAARLYDTALSPDQVQASFATGPTVVTTGEIDSQLSVAQRSTRGVLRKELQESTTELTRLAQRTANAKVYTNVPGVPGVTRHLIRGNLNKPGAIVTPTGLEAVRGPRADFGLVADATDADRRRKLAEWITARNNPLFARVIVNRLWHHHFGIGLVETPSDFGFNGGRPSHPELLDWLAAELSSRHYSLKAMHRLIVTSATYRQSSAMRPEAFARDADNRLLWRYKPRRLEGEAVRDAMLAVSGLLNPEVGGQGFSDYQARDYNGTMYFEPFDPVGSPFHRRSIYRFTPRGANQGLLETYDCPDPATATPRRAVTTTPLQALALWNNGFALRMADAFATRVARETGVVNEQVTKAWQLAYQRDPTPEEARLAAKLVHDHGLKALCRVLFNSNEFVTVE